MTLSLACATLLGLAVSATETRADDVEALNGSGPRYSEDGQLMRPQGWRKWVYIGTPLTPHDMNDGKAAFPEFHNVYIDPESFATFERTGEFPNGTQIVKELVLVGSKSAVSGNGYFMGEFAGLEVALKDTQRFKDEPGGWAYFSFGHVAADKYEATAKPFPAESCNACHQASADYDYVFLQYYPVLRAAMPKKMMMKAADAQASMKKMDAKSMATAMGAVGESGSSESSGSSEEPYSTKVFNWLKAGGYKNYKAESAVHPSSSGPAVHGDVRIFVNDKLDASMLAGNDKHPTGSVVVKELHKDGAMYGWAAMIKAREDDGKGNGWYWYEVLSTTNPENPVAASLGNQSCVGCHAPGRDFVRIGAIK
ncbi:MAG: hypothetical protein Aurels2KO_05870 [Aureliella sp.]